MALVINPDENVTISQGDYVDQHSPIELDLETRTFSSFVANGTPYVVAIAGDRNSQKITINTPVEYDGIDLYGTTCYLAWETTWKDDEGKVSKGVIDLGTAKYLQNGEEVDWSEVTPSVTDRLQFYWWIDEKQAARPGDCLFKMLFVLSDDSVEKTEIEDYCLASKAGKFAIENSGFSEALSDETPSLVFDTIDVNSIHKIEGWIEDFEALLKNEGIDNLGDKFNQIDESIENLNDAVTKIAEYTDNLKPRFIKVEEDVQSLNNTVSNVTRYIDNILSPELGTIEGELININNTIDEIDQLVTESQEDIIALEQLIAEKKDNNDNIENGFAEGAIQTADECRPNLIGARNGAAFGQWDMIYHGAHSFTAGRANQIDSAGTAAAIGLRDSVKGYSAVALGRDAEAMGDETLAAGGEVIASGDHSVALNDSTIADGEDQIAIGKLNAPNENAALIVGNGEVERRNAMTIQKDGRVTVGGHFEEAVFENNVPTQYNDKYTRLVADSQYLVEDPDLEGTDGYAFINNGPTKTTLRGNSSGRIASDRFYDELGWKCVKFKLNQNSLVGYARTMLTTSDGAVEAMNYSHPYPMTITAWFYSDEECDATIYLGLAKYNNGIAETDHHHVFETIVHFEAGVWQGVTLYLPVRGDDGTGRKYITIGASRPDCGPDNIKWLYMSNVTHFNGNRKEIKTYDYPNNIAKGAIKVNDSNYVDIAKYNNKKCLHFHSTTQAGATRAQTMMLDEDGNPIKIYAGKTYNVSFTYYSNTNPNIDSENMSYWLCATEDMSGKDNDFTSTAIKDKYVLWEKNITIYTISASIQFTAPISGYLRMGATRQKASGGTKAADIYITDFVFLEDDKQIAVYPYKSKYGNYFTNLYKIAEPQSTSVNARDWLIGKTLKIGSTNYTIQESDIPLITYKDSEEIITEGLYDDQVHPRVVRDGKVVLCNVDRLFPWRIGATERGIYVDVSVKSLTYNKWVDSNPIDLTNIGGGGNTEELENRIDATEAKVNSIEQDIDTALDAILNLQYSLIGGEG